jgi:hypothetical protein
MTTILPPNEYENTRQDKEETAALCDICDTFIDLENLCTLYIQGITEKLYCHAKCLDEYFSCKGDFTLLPEGRLKRSIMKAINEASTTLLKNTGITIRDKQARHIIKGLQISQEEGYKRVNTLAVDFYNLPRPLDENGEFYSIDNKKQIVLLRKVDDKDNDKDKDKGMNFDVLETSRE